VPCQGLARTGKPIYRHRTLGSRMAKEVEGVAPAVPKNTLKALGVAILVDLALLPPIFVLFVFWPIYYLALVPYIGGRLGGRYVDRAAAVRVGVVAAMTGVTVLVVLFLSLLGMMPSDTFNPFETIGLSIVAVAYLVAMLFGAIGGRHSGPVPDDG
jgi:hypothetical protein